MWTRPPPRVSVPPRSKGPTRVWDRVGVIHSQVLLKHLLYVQPSSQRGDTTKEKNKFPVIMEFISESSHFTEEPVKAHKENFLGGPVVKTVLPM